ncbi:response regulator [Lysobacter sp. A6]|uniref:Response regulator n=1 Tax=Noviluteimonas lactosilytica TaxID=2888523 RepID=A0ABS8JE43_9GAMM|nr:response regulator [Lysobacter lactosilyticus]MCC8361876.1 response regulator [Lysobacter lactosilyticus]
MISAADILAARILVVDDDLDALRTLEQSLTSAGYSTLTCTTDPRRVAALHAEHDFDAILLDVLMPGMDGFEVMEALKPGERGGYLPVLALTAEPGHRTQALRYGAKDFLRKPFDPEELLLRVRNLVEVRLLYKDAASAVSIDRAVAAA